MGCELLGTWVRVLHSSALRYKTIGRRYVLVTSLLPATLMTIARFAVTTIHRLGFSSSNMSLPLTFGVLLLASFVRAQSGMSALTF
jgi:hypothetical protein